jgi:hypothetical protein
MAPCAKDSSADLRMAAERKTSELQAFVVSFQMREVRPFDSMLKRNSAYE